MEAVTLSDLGPIIAAVLGPMLVFVAASMRYQHLDSTKTRDLIEQSSKDNRDLIEKSSKENRRLIEKNRDLIEQSNKETRDLLRANHAALSGSLADARERLGGGHRQGRSRIQPRGRARAVGSNRGPL